MAKKTSFFAHSSFFDDSPMRSEVEFEAKHQIPFPLSELVWDFRLQNEEQVYRDDQPHHVLLLAAKEFHVTDRLAMFKHAGIDVDVLQSDAVALHNLIAYEFFSEPIEIPASRTALAIVDVGNDSTASSSRRASEFGFARLIWEATILPRRLSDISSCRTARRSCSSAIPPRPAG